MICVEGGKLPTHRACPDCLGFRGGPRSTEVFKEELEEVRLTALKISKCYIHV